MKASGPRVCRSSFRFEAASQRRGSRKLTVLPEPTMTRKSNDTRRKVALPPELTIDKAPCARRERT
eukprot:scaffold167235_cov31-Tisochrysis_lutea.AAC.4